MPVCAREPAMVCAIWFRSSCGRVVDDAYGVRPELADEAADREDGCDERGAATGECSGTREHGRQGPEVLADRAFVGLGTPQVLIHAVEVIADNGPFPVVQSSGQRRRTKRVTADCTSEVVAIVPC